MRSDGNKKGHATMIPALVKCVETTQVKQGANVHKAHVSPLIGSDRPCHCGACHPPPKFGVRDSSLVPVEVLAASVHDSWMIWQGKSEHKIINDLFTHTGVNCVDEVLGKN